jgi:hypothetical protein
MGRTTELRRALKSDVFPLLLERGFAIDERNAPRFVDFRRTRSDQVDFLELQWEKSGKPRFRLSFGTVSSKGTIAQGIHTPARDMGPGQAPLYVRLYPRGTGSSTRDWFCQDPPFWARMFGWPARAPSDVTAEVLALLPEIDGYLLGGKMGPHCFAMPNAPFVNVT